MKALARTRPMGELPIDALNCAAGEIAVITKEPSHPTRALAF
jgi:hypothetical protein